MMQGRKISADCFKRMKGDEVNMQWLENDPLGYDTSDPSYLRQMIDDIETGRTQEALDAELEAVRRR